MTRPPLAGRGPPRRRPRPRQPQAFRPPRPGDGARHSLAASPGAAVDRARGRSSSTPRASGSAARSDRRDRRGRDSARSAGFRVRAIPSAHEGLDTDADGRHLYLGFVIEVEGLRLYHSGDSVALRRPGRPARCRAVRRPVPADQRPRPAREASRGTCRRPRRSTWRPESGRGSSCRITTTCSPSTRSPSGEFEAEARRLPAGVEAAGPAVRRALGDRAVSVTLGIDIGTSGTKTLAIDEPGAILASASAEYPCDHPQAGLVRAGPRALVGGDRGDRPRGARRRRAQAGRRRGRRPERADARLGLPRRRRARSSGPPCSGTTSGPPPSAPRSSERAGGREALIRMVGNPALTGFTAPKLLWVRNHEPANWDRVRQVLLPKDYVRYRLTGTYATEVSDASGTLLLDVANRRWSRELLGKLDLDPALLPACYESPEVSAKVSAIGLEGDGPGRGHARRRRRRRPAGRRRGQRDRPAGRRLGDDGDLGRRLRPHDRARASTRSAGSSAAVTRSRAPGTSWASCWRPAAASSGSATSWARPRSTQAQRAGRRPLLPPDRRGRARRPRGRGAVLPALPDGRADASLRSRRQGRLDRPDRPSRPAAPDPQPCSKGRPTRCATASS